MLSNEAIFNDTLRIIEDGYYTKDEQLVMLKYSTKESQESKSVTFVFKYTNIFSAVSGKNECNNTAEIRIDSSKL